MFTSRLPNLMCLLLAAAVLLLGPGCAYEKRVVRSTWDSWRQLEWSDSRPSGTGEGRSPSDRGYTVELARYEGPESYAQAYHLVSAARQQTELGQLWHATQQGVTTLYAGRFRDDGEEAKAMLRQARSARIDGAKPFDDAKIVKLTRTSGEVLDPRDLRTLKGRNLYTLQIGYFDRDYGNNYRRAAETAVDVLREQGEEAYYYHGPNRSMVLIHAWTYQEAFTLQGQVDRYSNAVRAVQEKYPQNVPNGQPFGDDEDPEVLSAHRSFLVPIR